MSDRPGDVAEWVIEQVRSRTVAEADGRQNVQSNVWTSKQRLKAEASKTDLLERSDVADVVADAVEAGGLITWHGLVAPADHNHLVTIIENERQSDAPRSLLISRVNRIRSKGKLVADGGQVRDSDGVSESNDERPREFDTIALGVALSVVGSLLLYIQGGQMPVLGAMGTAVGAFGLGFGLGAFAVWECGHDE